MATRVTNNPLHSIASLALPPLALLLASAALGLLASYPFWFMTVAGLAMMVALALAGEEAILAVIIISSGISVNSLVDSHMGVLSRFGANIDGLRLMLVLGSSVLLCMRRPGLIGSTAVAYPYVAFVVFALITLLWTPSLKDGLRFASKLIYPLVVWVMAWSVIERRGGQWVFSLIRTAAIVSTLFNLAIALTGASPFSGIGYEERFGGASHPNTIGLFAAIAGVMLYANYMRTGQRFDLWLALVLAAQVIATGSRTALVAGGVGYVIMEASRRRWRNVVLLAGIGTLVWLAVPTFGERTAGLASSGAAEMGGINLSGRLTLWGDAWSSLMRGDQFMGRGLGATDVYFADRYASLRSIHNGYLLLLIDTGFIGLGLALAFFVITAVRFLARVVSGNSSPHVGMALASLVAFLMSTVTESTFGGYAFPLTLLWLALALAIAEMPGSGQLHLRGGR